MEPLAPPGARRRLFAALSGLTLLIAFASALVLAVLDASTLAGGASGGAQSARSAWLYTFGVAILTCGVALFALMAGAAARSRGADVVYRLTAIGNLTVLIVEWTSDGLGIIGATAHCLLAALLIGMAQHRRGNPPKYRAPRLRGLITPGEQTGVHGAANGT